MNEAGKWFREVIALAGCLALGYAWGHSATPVKAAMPDDVQFQLAPVGVNENSSLLVYQASLRTVSVFRSAATGSSHLQCSYRFVLRPGGDIERESCPVPVLR